MKNAARKVKAKHVVPASFAPFGRVVTRPAGTPTSEGPDYRFWSDLADYSIDGETEIGICAVYKQPRRQVAGIERHLRTPEILIPIDAPFILPVAREEDPGAIEAFRVNVGEVVVINKAVWHGPCLPVGKKRSTYFVIFRKNTPHEDVQKQSIPPVEIAP